MLLPPLLLLVSLCLSLTSCASQPTRRGSASAEMAVLEAFHADRSRWPRDVAELQEFSDSHALGFDSAHYRAFEISSGISWVRVRYETTDGHSGFLGSSVSDVPDAKGTDGNIAD